jgi:16S rRNA (cytosine1402-N4)-methyltransferase
MTDPSPEDKPARRPRYRGANPRQFAEKYKELQPDRYPDDVAKVIASGRTAAGSHRPIMVREILEALSPRPGEVAVDCTLGYGGHAREILAAVQPGGRLIALDVDPIEGQKAEARLRALGFPEGALAVWRRNFAGLPALLAAEAPGGADVILADLGLSSMQIDDPARGFTFKGDGPLDMRMDPARGRPASALLAGLDEATLARILAENADEPRAAVVAAAVVRARARTPLTTTRALATVVRTAYGRRSEGEVGDATRRVFQAIRVAVNGEFASLEALLRALPSCLRPGGRVAVLTFHSGEDRRVKAAFKEGLQAGSYASIANGVVRASAEERRANPRATSAKLRFAVRSTVR